MLQKNTAITWKPLSVAFAHVLKHERSRELTAYRLRRVLGTRKPGLPQVRCRAGFVVAPNQSRRERENVMLSGDFWLLEVDIDSAPDEGAVVDWAEDSARLPASHPWAPWSAYRIEVYWEDLRAIWPAPTKRRRGRKPVHDRESILAVAEVYLSTHSRPKSVNQFAAKIEALLREKGGNYPRRSFLLELLAPLLASAN